MPRTTLRIFVLVCIACAGACHSVDWQPSPTPDVRWRGASLRVGELCGVVARSTGEAEEAYEFFAEVVEVLASFGEPPLATPLIVVTETDSEPWFDDVEQLQEAVERWSDGATNRMQMQSGPRGEQVPFAMIAPMLVLAPPLDAAELALPDAWQQRYQKLLVMPSETVRRAVMSRMLDYAMDQRDDIGFGERLLMTAAWPMLSGTVYGRMRRQQQKQTAMMLAPGRSFPDEVLDALEDGQH